MSEDPDCDYCGLRQTAHPSGLCVDCRESEVSVEQPGRPVEPITLCCYGILLMVAIKGIGVHWIGLDEDAWYVWPFEWVAFGMMFPVLVEWVNETRREWND